MILHARLCTITGLVVLACGVVGHVSAQNQEYDFAITPAFLQQLETGHTILPAVRVHIDARSNVKGLSQDCEVHLAGHVLDQAFGDPAGVVSEPPNDCEFLPNASNPTSGSTATTWRALIDHHMIGKDCTVTGFPRIFTEHVASGEAGTSNPNHVFELHPALKIACDSETPVAFFPALTAPAGLRHITASSAASCLSTRTLSVRFKDGQYEFLQHAGPGCGNFAIVEIGSLNPAWIRAMTGGHTAIARVSADGSTRVSLKVYTLGGTAIDDWLAGLMPAAGQPATIPPEHILVHGVITYDYFAMIRVLHPQGSSGWQQPTDWTDVPFPLAFVIYGKTATVPWTE
jgi:hypothetical protein